MENNYVFRGRDILVGIATNYSLHNRGKDSWWEAIISPPVQGYPGTHTIPCTMGYGVIPGVKRPVFAVDKKKPN